MIITTIGFDADDTLWQNEAFFRMTHERFALLLSDSDPALLTERLEAAERRNLGHYGFGIKGFMLSMIETAIEVTEGRVSTLVISEIMDAGRDMLRHPIHLLPFARETVTALSDQHRLVLITKGDLLDQERKLAQSGLGDLFHAVEIVSDKTPQVYLTAFARHGAGPETAVMVGNSLKSDVMPALQAGAWGVHVPHELTWSFEQAEPPIDCARFRAIPDLGALPALIEALRQLP